MSIVLTAGLLPLPTFTRTAVAAESDSTAATGTATGGLSATDAAAIAQSEANGECEAGEALVVYHSSGAAKGATGLLSIQSATDPLDAAGFGATDTWDLSGADSSASAAADGALSVQSEQTGSAIATGSDVRVALVKRPDMSTADLVASLDSLSFVECAQPNYLIPRESLSDDGSGIAALASTAAGAASAKTSSGSTSSGSASSSSSSVSTKSSSTPSTTSSSSSLKSQKLVTQSFTPQSAITTDLFNSLQWGLSGTNSEIAGSTAGIGYKTALEKEATSTATKDSVVVAILDTGVDYNNPDLKDQMWTDPGTIGLGTFGSHGYNGVTGDYDPMPEAGSSHGTHCAGIAAAATNNGIGVASTSGANSHTQIMGLRHEDSRGYLPTCASVACYEYLVRARAAGVNVVAVNCSWGVPTASLYDPVLDYAVNQAGKAGVLSCFAAGNTGTDANHDYSGACLESPYYISVASSTKDAVLWSSSCYDQTAVDVAAPGANVLSTVPYASGTEEFTPLLSYKAGKKTKDQGMYYYTDIASLGTSGASGISYQLYDASTKKMFACDGAATLDTTGTLFESNALKVTYDCDKITDAGHDPNYVAIVLSWPMDNPFKGAIDTDPSHYALGVAVSGVGFKGGEAVWAVEGLLSGSTNLAKSASYASANADTNWFDCAPLTSLDMTSETLTAQVNIEFGDFADPSIPLTGTKSCLLTGYGVGKTTDPTKDTSSAFVPYAFMSGTSMATPMITGSIAELAALYPNYTPLQLRGLVCGGTTSITTPTKDRYGNTKHTASDGRFTFEKALNTSTVNANTWSITTSDNQVTVHGYNLNGAKLYVDDTSHMTVTATGTQADSITFTAASSLFDGKAHRFDVVDGTTGRYYNASYVTPDSSKDTLVRISDLPASQNASTGKLVSTVDRLFYADGQGTYLYSCANPSDATASWSKLAAPGAAFTGAKSPNSKDIEYACMDSTIYAFATGDGAVSASGTTRFSLKCNTYSITNGTWSGWKEIGTADSYYVERFSVSAVNGMVCCYLRGWMPGDTRFYLLYTAKAGTADFSARDVDEVSLYSLSSAGNTLLYSFVPAMLDIPDTYALGVMSLDPATGKMSKVGIVSGFTPASSSYTTRSDANTCQTGAGNGFVTAGISDTNLGDLQLIGTDCTTTKLGDFGLSAADGLTVGSMIMHNGRLYLNCVDHATENGTGTGLYTLPSTAAAKVATTDVTATAKAETGGTVSVADWRGGTGSMQAAALSAQSAGTVDSVQMRAGDTATWTATADAGYAFKGWYDASGTLVSGNTTYSAPVPTSTTLTARFAAGTATAYAVRHFKQQPDGTYAATPDEIDELSGTTDAQTSAVAKSYTGFTARAFAQRAIAGDGSTVVDIDYARNVCTVSFDDNGGSGTMESIAMTYGVARKLPASTFARDGYTFAGWNTKADGTGTALADEASVENLSAENGVTVTLYAQWMQGPTPASTHASYKAVNGGSSPASTALTGDTALPFAIFLGALAAAAAVLLIARRRKGE